MSEAHLIGRIEKGRSFLKRHDKWLSMFGALIVFGTFLIKDALKESAREARDSFESARVNYVSRHNAEEIRTAVVSGMTDSAKNVDLLIEAILNRSDPRKHDFVSDRSLQFFLDSSDQFIQHAERNIGLASELADRIPSAIAERKTILEMKTRLESTKAKLQDVRQYEERKDIHSEDRSIQKQMPSENSTDEFEARYSEVEHAVVDSMKITQDVTRISDQIVSNAEKEANRLQARYDHYTLASYGLYIFGWTLALAGRLFGVGELVAVE
ncbi:MAG TPA: hypothetical protein VGF96_08935 [Terracidiphilus sp.]|jgi:hypothetical protein